MLFCSLLVFKNPTESRWDVMEPKGLSYTLKGNFGMILDAEGQRFESSFCKGADCQYFGLHRPEVPLTATEVF